uniref:Uncharacterized protein n=1 Tax=Anguilla anguilla TaxID=7936 RepID=A0A0E9QVZ8_ANGAN
MKDRQVHVLIWSTQYGPECKSFECKKSLCKIYIKRFQNTFCETISANKPM